MPNKDGYSRNQIKKLKVQLNDIMSQWAAWTPTLTWSTATPSGIVTTARYKIIGKICFVQIRIVCTSGNGATQLEITNLPVLPKGNNVRPIAQSMFWLNGTNAFGNRQGVLIDDGTQNKITWFYNNSNNYPSNSGATSEIIVSTQYEIP